jgi:UDP-N-acetylmuramyl pentapeptide synthase
METLLATYLGFWARRYIARTGVKLVAITGSVGKTTTKTAIGTVLKDTFPTRTVAGNLNGPYGVAIGILGGGWDEMYYEVGGGAWFWFRACLAAPFRALFSPADAEFIVVEFGADRPGDIAWLVDHFPPHVAVVTAVGDVPVHVEYYASAQHVASEKANILRHLADGDIAVLNADDWTVFEMRERVRHATVVTFGASEGPDVRATGLQLLQEAGAVTGVMFDVHAGGAVHPVRVHGALGRSQALACAAAVAVGTALGLPAGACVGALAAYRPPAGRLRLLRGIKGTTLLDDTYNAAPAAVQNALEALRDIHAKRRIAVLGDMLELGGATIRAHEGVGNRAGDVADILIGVGERARFIVDAARNQLPRNHTYWFRTAREAGLKIQELLEPGDVALIKGSQGMRMERITKEIMADPGRASQLLVRQSARWLRKA